jgi:carboxymethylenebutenolidase
LSTYEEITVATADGAMPAYQASPGPEAKGAVVVVQEAFGVTAHIQEVTRRLAGAGWHAVAPAFFHRQGAPALAYDDVEHAMPLMGALTAEGIDMDLTSTFDHLEAGGFPSERIGVVGFCMGGNVTFYAATMRPLGAAVTFYGGGVTEGRFGFPPLTELASKLQTPWLGLFGDLDRGIPVEDVEDLRIATASVGVPTEIVRYADADHGFNCDDRPSVFNQGAADDAWVRTLAWFDRFVRT